MQIDKARGIVMDWEESVREKPSSVEDLYTTLNAKVARLNVLGQILEDPVPNIFEAEEARTLNSLQDRPAHQYFVDLVGSRFPHAEDRLVEKLGRSNWNRYNHVQKQRESAKDELEVVSTNKAKSVFHDSGIGSSAPAQSEYAATVISSRAGASHKRLPSLPEKARSGQPFKCDVCDSAVKIRRIKEWK